MTDYESDEDKSLLTIFIFFIDDLYVLIDFIYTKKIIFVNNKAKGRISREVTRKQSSPNFAKNEHFLLLDIRG